MIKISNDHVVACFDEQTGRWVSLHFAGDERSLIRRNGLPFDLLIDGHPLSRDLALKTPNPEPISDGRGIRFTYELKGLRVQHTAELDTALPLLRQSVHVQCLEGGLRRMTDVVYSLPGLCVGEAKDCLLQTPGGRVPPDTPYLEVAQCPRPAVRRFGPNWIEIAPDQAPGVIAVENVAEGRIVSSWIYSEETTTFPTLDGEGDTVSVEHRHHLACWLRPGVDAESDGYCILLTRGSLWDHLEVFRREAYGDRLVSASDVPEWVREARLLQIGSRAAGTAQHPGPHPFCPEKLVALWQPRLDEIRRWGFNLVQVMPAYAYEENCYCIHDHFRIDPRIASEEQMRDFVAAAHERGIRVIFDLLPQGIGVHSPFVEEHADWLVRDELGQPLASHGWGPRAGEPAEGGTYSLDWGNPAYRRFVIDWALWAVETFDIDGFRTDALSWKEPNFDLGNPRPAWETVFGGVRLAEELRPALKQLKEDAILFCEVGGAIFQRSHDALYENHWLLGPVNRGWLSGQPILTGAQRARYLALAKAARPEGVLWAHFQSNHDYYRLTEIIHTNPLGDTINFMHAFSDGFPFVWWEEVEGREEFFQTLLRQRDALRGYTCSHRGAVPTSQHLFTAVWSRPGQPPVLAVANVSHEDVWSAISLEERPAAVVVTYGTGGVRACPSPEGLLIEMPAAGYALLALEGEAGDARDGED